MRPNDILDHWGVPELIVCYGQYRNEDALANYKEWESANTKKKKAVERPLKYDVMFISPDYYEDIPEDIEE